MDIKRHVYLYIFCYIPLCVSNTGAPYFYQYTYNDYPVKQHICHVVECLTLELAEELTHDDID